MGWSVSQPASLSITAPPNLSEHMGLILESVRRAAAARAAKRPWLVATVLLLWPYLHRLGARFDRLLARHAAGRLAPPRSRPLSAQGALPRTASPPAASPRAASPPAASPRAPRLPGGFAWVLRLVPGAGSFGSQLRHLLNRPEMAALLAEAPQAGRLLRPLCRMLGVGPDPDVPAALFPPRVARPRSQPAPPAQRERSRSDRAPDATTDATTDATPDATPDATTDATTDATRATILAPKDSVSKSV